MSKNILSKSYQGAEWSPSNTTILLNGIVVNMWQSLSYSESATKENLYGGSSRTPQARGYGNYTYEGTISLFASEVLALQQASQNTDGDITSNGLSTLIVAYVPTEGQGAPRTDVLRNLEFTSNMRNLAAGDTSIIVDIPFVFTDPTWGTPV
jgi:hypothetical protein